VKSWTPESTTATCTEWTPSGAPAPVDGSATAPTTCSADLFSQSCYFVALDSGHYEAGCAPNDSLLFSAKQF